MSKYNKFISQPQKHEVSLPNPQTIDWKQVARDIPSMAVIVSACRRAGKSYLCREIVYNICPIYKPDLVVLFSETADFNDDFDYISPHFKFSTFDEEKLGNFIEQQEEHMKKYKKLKKEGKDRGKKPPSILMIFDDIAHVKDVFWSKNLMKLFTVGRHIACTVVFLTQNLSSLAPIMRKNSDVIITFKDPNFNNQKILIEQHMCLKSDTNFRKQCREWMDVCLNQEYMALCICMFKVQQSKELTDYVYQYKASHNAPKFRVGQKEFWQENQAKLNSQSNKGPKTRGLGLSAQALELFEKL
mgnify:CR=1 FL=1|tara:strand:+ start:626 stop:1525 length:900 start_codon:yes stop_codon:yes gene_type:complete